jgi:hypothetical protein
MYEPAPDTHCFLRPWKRVCTLLRLVDTSVPLNRRYSSLALIAWGRDGCMKIISDMRSCWARHWSADVSVARISRSVQGGDVVQQSSHAWGSGAWSRRGLKTTLVSPGHARGDTRVATQRSANKDCWERSGAAGPRSME